MASKTQRPEGEFFAVRRDPWVGVLLWGTIFATLLPLGIVMAKEGWGGVVLGTVILIGYSMIAWIWFGSYYVIGKDTLFIRFGPLRTRIKLSDITQIGETRDILRAPALFSAALSVDRVVVRYARYNTGYGSPKEKARFIAALAAGCPKARVVRTDEA